MIIKTKKDIPSSEITPPEIFRERRKFIQMLGITLASANIPPVFANDNKVNFPNLIKNAPSDNALTATPFELVKNYTNYYEFTFNKDDSTKLAQSMIIDPWSVEISGEVEKSAVYHLEDILSQQTLEERIYRFRCVEGWSMVVPWIGFSLANLLKMAKPLSTAQFVKFTTIQQPETMPNQRDKKLLEFHYV